jgi:hypothetical protein
MAQIYTKDPDDDLDYAFNWADWLATGETISSYTLTVPTGLTEGSGAKATSESSGVITYWISGGTAGSSYDVGCKITTNAGRVKEKSMTFRINNH